MRVALPLLLLLLSLVGLLVAYLSAPLLLWSLDIQRAGRLVAGGVEWPEPRLVDSLPHARDAVALEEALAFLSSATRRRPEHPHAYRMMAQAHLALGDAVRAAEAVEQALARLPHNPLLAWESSLINEQMVRAIAGAPREPLLATFLTGELEAPAGPIDTPYCQPDQPQRCYMGETSFALPFAALPEGPEVAAPVLFLHPPARLSQTFVVPTEQTALTFMLGLDPQARDWGSDGATFQIWLVPVEGPSALVFQRTLDGETAAAGWVVDWADLSPWAGQEVTLLLGSHAGPAGDGSGDWYGWGDLSFTTLEAARYSVALPAARMVAGWRAAHLAPATFVQRGEQAARAGRDEEALSWYGRAAYADSGDAFPELFTLMLQAIEDRRSDVLALVQGLQVQDPTLEIYGIGDRVPGTRFRWTLPIPEVDVQVGDPLTSLTGDSVGVLFWYGSASAVFTVDEPGDYILRTSVQHAEPPPIEMAVGINGKKVQTYLLSRADNSWQTLELPVSLSEGIHTVDVWFLNDGIVNGIDRDASLGWVELVSTDMMQGRNYEFARLLQALEDQDPEAYELAQAFTTIEPLFQVNAVGERIVGSAMWWATELPASDSDGPFAKSLDSPLPGSAGVLWWTGEAITVVEVEQPGTYWIRASLQHAEPPPVEMAMGVNGHRLENIELDRGDQTWQLVEVPVSLSAGLHALSMWFLNDAVVDGIDRDASVAWIELVSDDMMQNQDYQFERMVQAINQQNLEAPALVEGYLQVDSAFSVFNVGDTIPATELRWSTSEADLRAGSELLPLDDGAAVMPWSGQAVAVIAVEEPASYRLRLSVLDAEPAPIEMAIGINGLQLHNFELTREDQTWQIVEVPVTLQAGLHTINIWYLNDMVVDGVDRNAVLQWVELLSGSP
jgi:hypothetical protein